MGMELREMSKTTEQKCPFPDCDVVRLRSALMKKHLNEVHYAALGADFDNKKVVKSEPSDMLEIEQHDVSGDDRKVPPLRVKISKVISKKEPKEPKEAKPFAINLNQIICIFLVDIKNLVKRKWRLNNNSLNKLWKIRNKNKMKAILPLKFQSISNRRILKRMKKFMNHLCRKLMMKNMK